MELNLEISDSPLRAAASVVLLRDGDTGLQVFLVRRHGLSDVLGGAYVFPGGKVDHDDANEDLQSRVDDDPARLQAMLGEPSLDTVQAVAVYVAAVREAFEETGVLFAAGPGPIDAPRAWRLLREGRAFDEVLAQLSLRLDTAALLPWSRWITPVVGGVIRKRFDTRFFLARVPAGQTATHDDHEATASVWLTPEEALRQYWEGSIELAPPQIMSLAHLWRHASVASALDEARRRRPPVIHPESFELKGARVVCYPGDPRHSVNIRALPGPTRLRFKGQRFEPIGGYEELFADR